jgi:MerR family transcriptional regulator, mercuric resistance operon regulatory protein
MVRSQESGSFTISKLAAAAGVGIETVRFYQRTGLLPLAIQKTGIRRYGETDLRRIRFIKQAQTAGFSLAEIKELLELDEGEDRARARELARSRIQALNTKIEELERARDGLERLARQCASGTTGPCPILTAFDVKPNRT